MRRVLLVAFAISLLAPMAMAQDDGDAADLDELLRLIQEGRARDQQEHREREARFRAARDEQQSLLSEARRAVAVAENRSSELEREFNANDLQLAEVTEQLDRRMGSLRELFGVLQQVTGDTQALLGNSVTSAQFSDRSTFLIELDAELSSGVGLPSIEQIEQLWYLLQQEMTETGKVVKFPATVIAKDGRELQEDVVRVGGFNIVANGRYLQYTPETGNLSEIARQPQGRFRSTTARIFDVQESSLVFGVDPTRGQILESYLDRPDLRERIGQGGIVGYVIIGLGVIGLIISLERLVVLNRTNMKVSSQLKNDVNSVDNPLGRVLQVAEGLPTVDVDTLELKLGEAVLKESPGLTRGLLFLKIISVVAPLLGLLGTVTGMIVTFQAITLFGTGDPKLMAGGISQALVTTVLGLTVAIPIVLLHTLVSGRSRRILHILREQSAGIVAERSETRV